MCWWACAGRGQGMVHGSSLSAVTCSSAGAGGMDYPSSYCPTSHAPTCSRTWVPVRVKQHQVVGPHEVEACTPRTRGQQEHLRVSIWGEVRAAQQVAVLVE